MGAIHIGTSGWNYKHWFGRFYPTDLRQDELLEFYTRHFDTVEINNTFYHLPKLKTFNAWREKVPETFLFAVKASRFITHMKKLKAPKTSSRKLFNRMARLKNKLGPVLFQLPPGWRFNRDRFAKFLAALPTEHQFVFEFREPSWFQDEVYELLKDHNVGFCIHDFRGAQTPLIVTADFTYIRMHGPTAAAYSGSYSHEALSDWAARIADWRKKLRDVYVYFNNDVEGHAIKNALTLRELCEKQEATRNDSAGVNQLPNCELTKFALFMRSAANS
jgi:uncharacterized protein YecE (DUF72 family)